VVAGGQEQPQTLSLNNPVNVGPYQLSQNTWLPEAESATEIIFSVASRPGLWVVWAGCWLIGLGMPIAFYVKPLLLRRGRVQK
jgi:hypothetical protein